MQESKMLRILTSRLWNNFLLLKDLYNYISMHVRERASKSRGPIEKDSVRFGNRRWLCKVSLIVG